MATHFYLVNLSGQGDTFYTLVDQETWDWINGPWPLGNERSGIDPTIPASIKDRLDGEGYITRGSWQNDRALQAPHAIFNGVEIKTFYSVKDLYAFMKDNDIEIVEEYEGYIY